MYKNKFILVFFTNVNFSCRKKQLNIIYLLFFLLSIFFHFPATAGYISIVTEPTISYRQEKIYADVKIQNNGDSPAKSLATEIEIANIHLISRAIPVLNPKQSIILHYETDFTEPPGLYTVKIRSNYSDPNGYPFSAINIIPLITSPDVTLSPLSLAIKTTEHAGGADINVFVSSTADYEIKAKLFLFLPDGLSSQPATTNITVPSHQGCNCFFKVYSSFALPGSKYSIAAIAEWMSPSGNPLSISENCLLYIKSEAWHLKLPSARSFFVTSIILMIACLILNRFFPAIERNSYVCLSAKTIAWLLIFAWFLYHLNPIYIFTNTIATGGDTPAHNYLASHLQKTLFTKGKIISWANGWWCGFPMFQYYFPLPYFLIAILSLLLPFNIAFRVVSILGVFSLPVSTFIFCRCIKLPRPIPLLSAASTLPFLFVSSHTMWGVNVYSTLAGMIANSIGFSFMLLFLGHIYEDAEDRSCRMRTILYGFSLVTSHFFTTVIASTIVIILPFIRRPTLIPQAIITILKEGVIILLLSAWWLVPLIAKHEYSVDFGENWKISLLKTFPVHFFYLAPFAFFAVFYCLYYRIHSIYIPLSIFLFSLCLYFFGFKLSPVFINIRLWPFLFFATIIMETWGIAIVLKLSKNKSLCVIPFALLCFAGARNNSENAIAWAKWNYGGIHHEFWNGIYKSLLCPIDGTAGRLANDLHPDNHTYFGSTRIFEAVPSILNKAILEGGIVNSAIGSLFSYYIQGETSQNCAGFPTIVKPPRFNITNATIHLEMFNVKHFIACWDNTKEALSSHSAWKQIGEYKRWKLFELTTHNGNYVTIPKFHPIPLKTTDWKKNALKWLYNINAADKPFILMNPNEPPPIETSVQSVNENTFASWLAGITNNSKSSEICFKPINTQAVISEEISDEKIVFKTTALHQPHIIKITWFPNWKVKGAKKVYRVTPCFLLVYPEKEKVELFYGYILSDKIGFFFTIIGCLTLLIIALNKTIRLIKSHSPIYTPAATASKSDINPCSNKYYD